MLRTIAIVAFLIVGLLPLHLAADEPPAAKGLLEGDWKLQSVEINAQALPMEKLRESKLTVRGAGYTLTIVDTKLAMTHKLLPDQRPPSMDLTVVDGPDKGKIFPAIYKLEGETLTVCRHIQPGQQRPTQFATKADTGLMLVVWTRQVAK